MRNQTSNTFNDGVNYDINPYQLPSTTMSDCVNGEILTQAGNEFILQNDKGNTYRTKIKDNYVPVGSKVYQGIAYILSAEVEEVLGIRQFTGRGEIGSFPSPDYTNLTLSNSQTLSGILLYEYQPFKNYLKEIYDPGDPLVLSESFSMYGTGSSVYGDFNSLQFNFTEKTSYALEVQPSFDGSVNIIFTDNINPIRIINSRFSPLKSNRVNIIDRTGQKDVNLYHQGLFETTINMIQSSNKLIDVDLKDITETGVLPCGTYRYYFAYQTQDGNYTDVLAETFQIPIFKGSTQLDIDAPSSFNSGKSVLISLKNLDTSFSQLRVYYTHHYGELAELSQTYLLTAPTPITGSSMTVTHTGREESMPIDSSIISTTFSTIDTVRTIAQTQSRLFLGNISLKGFDVATLSNFAAQIKPKWGKRRFQFNPTAFNIRVISNIPTTTGEIGYINGYYNPFNVYHHGSYWGGETYMFGIVFILKSGATTPVFPIRGIDDWNANNSTNGYNTQTLNESNNYFDTINRGENLKGVYRFPTRVNQTYQQVFNLQDDSNNLNIFGLELDIPTNYPEETIGCMFVRAPRVPDVITQGLVIDTVAVPIVDTTPQDYRGNRYYNYTWRPDAIKYVPAYNYIVEGSRMSGDRNANQGTGDDGLTPFQLTDHYWPFSTYKRRYALLTPSLYEESMASRINGTGYFVEQLGTITHKATVPTEAWWEVEQQYAKWWSVLRQTKSDPRFRVDINTSIEYVLAEQEATTINNFSSTAAFSVQRNNNRNHSYAVIRNNYNAYLGLATDSSLGINTILGVQNVLLTPFLLYSATTGSDLYPTTNSNFVVGSSFNTSITANIYKDLGYNRGTNPNDLTRLASSNIPTNQQYTPISKRMYWDATFRPDNEGVIVDRNKSYWGGDCFPAETYRRMFYNSQNREGIIGGAEAVVNTGYTISYIVESDIIPTMRSTFIFNITEEVTRRSFYPLLLDSNETPLEDRYNRNHQWRKYREVESNQINEGGRWLPEERIISPINPQLPFLRQRFPTRVMYSEINIYDSFLNGYRNVFPQNRQDYNQAYGEIIALKEINNVLICVQETAVSILPVNERTAVTNASSGAVFFDGANILSPYAQVLSGAYGSVLQDSVNKSESSVYGIDQQGGVWRVGQGGLQMISTGVLQSALKEFVPLISSREVNQLYNNIKFHYDQHKKTMYLSSYTSEEELGFNKLYTFVYSELTGKWITRYSYIPIETFNINDKHFAFEFKKNNEEIWEQHSNTIRCNYFGEQYEFEIEFCINDDPMSQKIFTNFVIASNEVPPKYIMYDTDNETPLDDVRPPFVADKPMVQQDIHELHRGRYYNGNPLDLRNSYFNHNAAYKENHHYIQIDKNTNDTRDGKPPAKPSMFDNNRQIRDKFLRVRFRYEGHEYSIIQAILTKYIISYS